MGGEGEREREREARQRLRRLVSEICSRGKRDDEEEKEERTMETSFVVSAAF